MTSTEIAKRFHGRRIGKGKWMAKCPAHRERTGSLSITDMGNGNTRLHCFAGCSQGDVIEAAGLQWKDLRAENNWTPPPPKPDWIEKDGPVWFNNSSGAMATAVICAMLLAVPERERGPLVGIWDNALGPIPDPASLIVGTWTSRPPDEYVVNPMLRNSVLQGQLKRAIISWYRLRVSGGYESEAHRIIAEYGIEELWECLPQNHTT